MSKWLLFLLLPLRLAAAPLSTAEQVEALIALQDTASAQKLVSQALQIAPDSPSLHKQQLRLLAAKGEAPALLSSWKHFKERFQEEGNDHDILEEIAWGILYSGSRSPAFMVQFYALVGSYLSQDVRGIEQLMEGAKSSNRALQAMAVQLISSYRDEPLRKLVIDLLTTETSWQVRLEALKAIGKMGIKGARGQLKMLIADERRSFEEREVATQSLVTLFDQVERQELMHLVNSSRAGLRLLALQLIDHFERVEEVDLAVRLLKDSHAPVRQHAILTIGRLQQTSLAVVPPALIHDSQPNVAITAAWALTLQDRSEGKLALEKWLHHPNRDHRLLAAAALASTGNFAIPLLHTTLKEHRDPYVRLNAGIGLIGQREHIALATSEVHRFLGEHHAKVMWKQLGSFQAIVPSDLPHVSHIPHHPETIDQLVRLDLLNILAIFDHPEVQGAVRRYLRERSWGVSATATATLATEGNQEAIGIIENLLTDPDERIRIQAALVSALVSRNKEASAVLIQAYPEAERELKERILEGLGQIGAKSSIPFLSERLSEPFPSLQVIAAVSLLRCLYG